MTTPPRAVAEPQNATLKKHSIPLRSKSSGIGYKPNGNEGPLLIPGAPLNEKFTENPTLNSAFDRKPSTMSVLSQKFYEKRSSIECSLESSTAQPLQKILFYIDLTRRE